jgi:hypothetical protein
MNIIYNKDSFDNAIEVENYPWGFKFKTKRRYWIETTKRGDRLCFQTLNPKTNKWCKPKKRTYDSVLVLYFDENDHVKTYGFHEYSRKDVYKFEKKVDVEKLNNNQRKKLCEAKAINHVYKDVTFSFENVTMMSAEEKAKRAEKNDRIKKQINTAINHAYNGCLIKNDLKEVV